MFGTCGVRAHPKSLVSPCISPPPHPCVEMTGRSEEKSIRCVFPPCQMLPRPPERNESIFTSKVLVHSTFSHLNEIETSSKRRNKKRSQFTPEKHIRRDALIIPLGAALWLLVNSVSDSAFLPGLPSVWSPPQAPFQLLSEGPWPLPAASPSCPQGVV